MTTGYAGYSWSNNAGVRANFTVPQVFAPVGSIAFWAGLYDSTAPVHIQQVGITANWNGSNMTYSAWYEMYPDNAVAFDPASYPVNHGDSLQFYVGKSGDAYSLEILNYTQNWHAVQAAGWSGNDDLGMCIAEGFGPALPGFEPVTFSSVSGTLSGSFTMPGTVLNRINDHEFQVSSS